MVSSGSPPSSTSLPWAIADQADDSAQQRRFSGAVAAGDGQNLAGGHGKAEAGEHVAPAAVTGQIDSGKPHQQRPGARGRISLPGCANRRRVAGHFIDHLLLIWHISGKDLISRKSGCAAPATPPAPHRQRSVGACFGNKLPPLCPGARPEEWEKNHGFARQLQVPAAAQGGLQDLRLLQPSGGGKERPQRDFAAAVLAEGAVGKPAAQRRRPLGIERGHPGRRAMAQDQDLGARDRVPPGAGADAGFHRRAGGGRSRRHARRHGASRRRSEKDQSAGAGRSGHRPFGGGEFLRPQGFVQAQRRRGIQAEPGALPVPEMGAKLVRGFPRRAARHRHLPPGQSRISVADGVDREGQGDFPGQVRRHRTRLSGHAGRHRFAHHHGERPLRARLGRRRHRGRGRHARPALFDGAAGSDRRALQRQAQGRRHRDRSGADRDADAAQARRRRQIRRIFRSRAWPV